MAEIEDYDQQVTVDYEPFCCKALENVPIQIPKGASEITVTCPTHGTKYRATLHHDGTGTVTFRRT